MILATNVRMCIYVNECSASLYSIVIKNIIKKVIFIAYFVLKYDKNEIFFN